VLGKLDCYLSIAEEEFSLWGEGGMEWGISGMGRWGLSEFYWILRRQI